MKKKSTLISIIIGVIAAIVIIQYLPNSNNSDNVVIKKPTSGSNTEQIVSQTQPNSNLTNSNMTNSTQTPIKRWVQVTEYIEGRPEVTYLPYDDFVFKVDYKINAQKEITAVSIGLDPKFSDLYYQIGFFDRKADTVVVYPLFTQAAYGENGFYDYYKKTCDSKCLTVNIPAKVTPIYQASGRTTVMLHLLHYDFVTDVDVDKNPKILQEYKKVIVLHNEYVTQREFDAITNHPNVLYLFPNSMYAKVQANYDNNTITLIRGHGYPDSSVDNGFDWKFDNSDFEYDIKCDKWQFQSVDNGKMLNCYPAFRMYYDKSLLFAIAQ
ncbi:MAG: hypothetical protein E6L02_07455 [Thaumarchaeota archaeon]|nr:MAG: hypothetical protein E6L02_07455 [Nitrososphaerota archaeon]